VYSIGSELNSPVATYPLGRDCFSIIITGNRLYVGGYRVLHVFEESSSLTEPLKYLTQIATEKEILKLLRVGHELLLG
jgi:hypothetical protein